MEVNKGPFYGGLTEESTFSSCHFHYCGQASGKQSVDRVTSENQPSEQPNVAQINEKTTDASKRTLVGLAFYSDESEDDD